MKKVTQTGMAVIGVVLLLAGAASAGWWEDAGEAKPVNLDEVIANPYAYKGKEISFECVFHKVSTFYNPYYTRFVPSQYLNFSVWPVSRKLWKQEDYVNSHPFLFLEKDHKAYTQLLGMEKYTRLRIVGYVQSTFKSTPWIEVRHVHVLEGSLTKDSLRDIIQGDRAAADGKWDEALSHYDHAMKRELPATVAASLEKKRGDAFAQKKDFAKAKASYEAALELLPGDDEARNELARANAQLGTKPETPAAAPAANAPKVPVPVEAKKIDPKRYLPAPMAMPVPVQPAKKPEAAPPEQKKAVEDFEATPIEMKGVVEEPKAQPRVPAVQPVPPVAQPKAAPVEPAPKIEKQPAEEEPGPNPKKRMSGPM